MQLTLKHPSFPVFTGRVRHIGVRSIAFGLLIALTGCGLGTSTSSSLVRSLNTYVPTAGSSAAVTITAGSTALTNGLSLGFGQFANGGSFVSTPSGTFTPSATGTGVSGTLLSLNATTLASNGASYMLLVVGQAGQNGTLAPQILVLPNYTTGQLTIPAGSAAIRVVNVSLNPNAIGLFGTSNGVPTTAIAPGVASLSYGYISGTNGYIVLPSAQLTHFSLVDVTAPQTPLSLVSTNTLNSFTFLSGQAYTLYIYGQPGNSAEPLSANWVLDFPAQ